MINLRKLWMFFIKRFTVNSHLNQHVITCLHCTELTLNMEYFFKRQRKFKWFFWRWGQMAQMEKRSCKGFADIRDIAISVRYVVGLSEFYYQKKKCKSISHSSLKLWQLLWSVSHLESYVDQHFISSSPCIRDFFCRRKLIHVYFFLFLRYVGNRQTDRQTDRCKQTDAGENIIPRHDGRR